MSNFILRGPTDHNALPTQPHFTLSLSLSLFPFFFFSLSHYNLPCLFRGDASAGRQSLTGKYQTPNAERQTLNTKCRVMGLSIIIIHSLTRSLTYTLTQLLPRRAIERLLVWTIMLTSISLFPRSKLQTDKTSPATRPSQSLSELRVVFCEQTKCILLRTIEQVNCVSLNCLLQLESAQFVDLGEGDKVTQAAME